MDSTEATAASRTWCNFETSRTILFIFGLIQSFSCSGIIFGFTAIASALKNIGQYSSLCSSTNSTSGTVHCANQDLRFSLLYTIGSSALFASFICHGIILDRIGPKIASCTGLTCISIGFYILSFSDSNGFDGYPEAFALIGAGGPGVHLSLFHLANLFREGIRGTMKSCLVGAFVMSAILFPLEGWLLEGVHANREYVFLVHASWLMLLALAGAFVWPIKRFQDGDKVYLRGFLLRYTIVPHSSIVENVEMPPQVTEDVVLEASKSEVISEYTSKSDGTQGDIDTQTDLGTESNARIPGTASNSLVNAPLLRQMRSKEYLLLFSFACIHVLRFNLYIGTFIQQIQYLEGKGNSSQTNVYTLALTLLLPFGALSIPLIGRIIDRYSLWHGFIFCNMLGMGYGITNVVPVLQVQFLSIIFISLHRMVLFAVLYSYTSATFGYANFGFLFGLMQLVAAVISLLVYPLASISDNQLGGNYMCVDLVMLAIMMPLWYFCPGQRPQGTASL
uniref:Major facilitator superfamily (MFS) profile domain-containing protein n=1 Tax=Guillardia theta TaxID=55529 RepID=A0A7S4P0Q3_GUITH|mmetsp:Transcript_40738/g.128406  ORF Transcript_40738/g.128406 Transcript_40738/m.128406 type:complete len:506 (+) Transcript_40738:341-1858(+)